MIARLSVAAGDMATSSVAVDAIDVGLGGLSRSVVVLVVVAIGTEAVIDASCAQERDTSSPEVSAVVERDIEVNCLLTAATGPSSFGVIAGEDGASDGASSEQAAPVAVFSFTVLSAGAQGVFIVCGLRLYNGGHAAFLFVFRVAGRPYRVPCRIRPVVLPICIMWLGSRRFREAGDGVSWASDSKAAFTKGTA